MKKAIIPCAALAVIFGIIAILTGTVLKDNIIISQSYNAWHNLFSYSLAISIADAAAAILLAVIALVRQHREHRALSELMDQQEQTARLDKTRKRREINTPEGVYAYVENTLIMDSRIAEQSVAIRKQLDKMNYAQQKLDSLLEINDMPGLEQSRVILQKIEDEMCAECRALINKYIVSSARGFQDAFPAVYENNEQRLQKVQQLLDAMADYANGQITKTDAMTVLNEYTSILQDEINRPSTLTFN